MNNKTAKKNMQVKRVDHPNRPQEPKPPYPYNEEEVTFENKTENVTLAGTLTIPQGSGPFPVALLIAGTGPHARDATYQGHKTFLVLADYLARNGIAVLRFDKRGCGESTGSFQMATMIDFADDVEAGINYLKSRKEIDSCHIGLIGHSEGGTIGTIVANGSQDVAFVVILASPGVNGEEIIDRQYSLFAKAEGDAQEAIAVGRRLLSQMIVVIKKEADSEVAKKKIYTIHTEYLAKLSDVQREADKTSTLHEFFEFFMSYAHWLSFYLTFEPTSELVKIKTPVLAFFCERDLLVPPTQNLEPFSQALKKAKNNDSTILLMPKLNHRFQHCNIGTEKEYATIEETISPEVLKIIAKWILERTIKKGPHE